jgi:hypothetical protein
MQSIRCLAAMVLGTLLLGGCVTHQSRKNIESLCGQLNDQVWHVTHDKGGQEKDYPHFSKPEIAALECGEAALPRMDRVLTESILGAEDADQPIYQSRDNAWLASYCISLSGEPGAKAILERAYGQSEDEWQHESIRAALCSLMGSGRDPEDIRFLEGALQGDYSGNTQRPCDDAALALGVRRASESLDALKRCRELNSNRLIGQAASAAIEWIEVGEYEVPSLNTPNEQDALLLAILRNGVGRAHDAVFLYEYGNGRKWALTGKRWNVETVPKADAIRLFPSIRLDSYVTRDGQRALVAVGLNFGIRNGSGYNYLLRKVDGIWKVECIYSTWVS